jgi:aspartate kinase
MSVIVREDALGDNEELIVDEIRKVIEPDSIEVERDIAMIATVGQGMSHCIGFASRLCAALARGKVNLRIIDQGASETNMIVGVENKDYEKAIRTLYAEFCNE